MGDALKNMDSKVQDRLDRIGKLGLFWNAGYDSFVNGDFNIGMTEVKTFSDEAFDNLLAKIKLEMERRGVLPVNEPKVIPLNKKVAETTVTPAPEKKVSIFGAAKVKPATKAAAKDDKIVVQIPGLEEKLLKLQTLKAEIADGEAMLSAITDEVKGLAKDEFVRLYKENKTNPNTFLIKDGNGCCMILPMDKYLIVKDESRANQLIGEYGKEVVTVDEKYYFNPEVLERNQDIIEELISNSTAISDADKENMLKKEVKYSIKKGMIDELYHFGNKMENAIADIQPIFMLKNCGGKAEEGGVISSGDLIDDVPVKLGYSLCCFAPVYGDAEVCSSCGKHCTVLTEEEVQNELAEAANEGYSEGGEVDRTSELSELEKNVAHMQLKRLYKELEKAQFDGNVNKVQDIVEKIQAIELADEGSEELEQLHEARGYGRGGSVEEKEFIKKIKSESGHILDKIKTSKGDTMIYYREYGSSPSDVKTKVFADGGEVDESWGEEMKGKYPVATDSYDVPNITDRWGYAGGGNVAAGKVWEASMIMNPIVPSELENPKHLVRIFHLGSASEKFDVEQQIAREGLNVREILSITEIANSNEWEDFIHMQKTGQGIAVRSKADALKTYPNLLKNKLVSFGGGKNGYNIKLTEKGENTPFVSKIYAHGGVAIAQKEFEISIGDNVYWGNYHYEGNKLFMDSCETMDVNGNLVDIYENGSPDKLHDIETYDKVYSKLEDDTRDEVMGRFDNDYDYATGGSVGEKYKLGDFVFARLYKDQSIKTPFIVSHWSHDAYYIIGDGSHYVKEEKLEPATAKDFDDYYGEGKAKEYVKALNTDEFGKSYEMGGNAAPGEWVVYNDETDTLIGKPHANRAAAKRAMNDLFKTGKYSAIGMETKAEWDSTHKHSSISEIIKEDEDNDGLLERYATGGTLSGFEKWKAALLAYQTAAEKNEHDKELSRIFNGSKNTGRFIYRSISLQNKSLYEKDCKEFGKEKVDGLVDEVLEITQNKKNHATGGKVGGAVNNGKAERGVMTYHTWNEDSTYYVPGIITGEKTIEKKMYYTFKPDESFKWEMSSSEWKLLLDETNGGFIPKRNIKEIPKSLNHKDAILTIGSVVSFDDLNGEKNVRMNLVEILPIPPKEGSRYYHFSNDVYHKYIEEPLLRRNLESGFVKLVASNKDGGGVSNRKWMEIKNDFTDDDGVTHIDAFLTEDDNEEGIVIATIDKEGNVTYIDGDAKTDPYAQEMIKGITDQKFADGGNVSGKKEDMFITFSSGSSVSEVESFKKFYKNLRSLMPDHNYEDLSKFAFQFYPTSQSDIDDAIKMAGSFGVPYSKSWGKLAEGGKLENRTELVFTAKTKEDADKLDELLQPKYGHYWFAERDGLSFTFPVSESDVDRTEEGVTSDIINKHDIHGHWESFN